MIFEWIAAEHHRLHLVEQWPEGAYKQAALAAIDSSLQGLLRNQRPADLPLCEVCLNRKRAVPLVAFPELFQLEHTDLAA